MLAQPSWTMYKRLCWWPYKNLKITSMNLTGRKLSQGAYARMKAWQSCRKAWCPKTGSLFLTTILFPVRWERAQGGPQLHAHAVLESRLPAPIHSTETDIVYNVSSRNTAYFGIACHGELSSLDLWPYDDQRMTCLVDHDAARGILTKLEFISY